VLPSLGSIVTGTSGINPSIVPGIGGGGIPLPGISSIATVARGSIDSALTFLSSPASAATVPFSSIRTATPGFNPAALTAEQQEIFNIGQRVNNGISTTVTTVAGTTPTLTEQINAVAQANGVDPNASLTAEQQEIFNIGQRVNNGLTTVVSDGRSGNFTEFYNSETGLYDVFNNDTGETVQTGLDQQAAILAAQDLSIGNDGQPLDPSPNPVDPANFPAYDDEGNLLPGYELDGDDNPYFAGFGPVRTNAADVNLANFPAYDDEGNLLPGYELDGDENPIFVGIAGINRSALLNNAAGATAGIIDQARQQQTVRAQRQNKAQAGDWRVRLRLAPQSNYLYNDPQCGPVLWPLRNTDGVIFPYTPTIDTAYKADYEPYNLTHSNYRGYFYKGSYVDPVNIKAMFTAQDTAEANYLLATIHFFRSATKMFYGQDAQRGAPPPLVYLSGLGDFQFNEHPCVIAQFNYNLPSDVDYIRAQSGGANGTSLQNQRDRQTIAGNPLSYALQRLATVGLTKGALPDRLAAPTLGLDDPTYVPTKLDINLLLYPMQSREQVSKQFSVKNFANGNLLKGGFW
jgi:hypothetical protein